MVLIGAKVCAARSLTFVAIISSFLGLFLVSLGHVAQGNGLGLSAQIIMAIGVIIFISNLFALFGLYMEKNWMLLIYFYSVLLSSVLVICMIFAALFMQEEMHAYLETNYEPLTDKFVDDGHEISNMTKKEFLEYVDQKVDDNLVLVGGCGTMYILFSIIGTFCSARILTLPSIMKNMIEILTSIFFVEGFLIAGGCAFMLFKGTGLNDDSQMVFLVGLAFGLLIVVTALSGLWGSLNRHRTSLLTHQVGIVIVIFSTIAITSYIVNYNDHITEKIDSYPDDDFVALLSGTPLEGESKTYCIQYVQLSTLMLSVVTVVCCLFYTLSFVSATLLRRSLIYYSTGSI